MFKYLLYTYLDFICYLFIMLGFSCLLLLVCLLMTINKPEFEKMSSYECGFDPFSDTSEPFEIKFYLISILFILFDMEMMFFLPWSVCQKELFITGFYNMYLFILLLVMGFFYEFKKGTLDWS